MKAPSIVQFGFFALALSFAVAACKQDKQDGVDTSLVHNPGRPPTAADSARMPILAFDTLEHNFGEIVEGDKPEYAFRFTNRGKGNLLLTNVHASCGCTTPHYPKNIIKPGGSDDIKVVYNSEGRPGTFRKSITVTSNTYPNTTKLIINGTVLPADQNSKQ
jgi:hypothetical protein